jgi:superfamily I DNA and/or RNA helicase
MVRTYLDATHERHASNYDAHMKKYGDVALAERDLRTFAATCAKVGSWPRLPIFKDPFNLILVDEAATGREPDLVQVLNVTSPVTSFHQIGDHKQLPATAQHAQNRADNNDVSLFERLIETACLPCVVLQEQHRMQPCIAAFPSLQYYSDSLTTRTPLRSRAPAGFCWPTSDPVEFVNVHSDTGHKQGGRDGTSSLCNTAEAKEVARIVADFHEYGRGQESSIAVVATYASQVAEIRWHLEGQQVTVAWVNSIDKAQGLEEDIIVASLLRSSTSGTLGFVADPRRLNVAMTRARQALILVGDYP